MTTVYDVPARDLIDLVSKKLQKEDAIVPPDGSNYWRTGVDKENPPLETDWWFSRCASILRKVYIMNAVGVERLRAEYGGKSDRGSKPYKAKKGGGSIVRRALQQLEKAGYVSRVKGRGRILTSKGRSFLDNTSEEVRRSLEASYPEMKKY
jgi:small subunit ribosomal protein S19e